MSLDSDILEAAATVVLIAHTKTAMARDIHEDGVSYESMAACSWCAMGAIAAAACELMGQTEYPVMYAERLRHKIEADFLKCDQLTIFNDGPKRTPRQVHNLLMRAANEYR